MVLFFINNPVLAGSSENKKEPAPAKEQGKPAMISAEDAEIIKNKDLLENLELLENWEKVKYMDLFMSDDKSKRSTKDKRVAQKQESKQ